MRRCAVGEPPEAAQKFQLLLVGSGDLHPAFVPARTCPRRHKSAESHENARGTTFLSHASSAHRHHQHHPCGPRKLASQRFRLFSTYYLKLTNLPWPVWVSRCIRRSTPWSHQYWRPFSGRQFRLDVASVGRRAWIRGNLEMKALNTSRDLAVSSESWDEASLLWKAIWTASKARLFRSC
jgi:hypothetical protein